MKQNNTSDMIPDLTDIGMTVDEFVSDYRIKSYKFLKENFNIDDVDSLSDGTFNELYEKLVDIEIEEVCKKSDPEAPISERGDLAAGWVTYMARQYDNEGKRKQNDNNKQ